MCKRFIPRPYIFCYTMHSSHGKQSKWEGLGTRLHPTSIHELAEVLLYVSHKQYSTIWWTFVSIQMWRVWVQLGLVVLAQFLILQVELVINHIVHYDAHSDNVEERCHSGILAGDVCCSVGVYQPTHKLRKWTKVLDNILASITDTNVSKLLWHLASLQRTDHTTKHKCQQIDFQALQQVRGGEEGDWLVEGSEICLL